MCSVQAAGGLNSPGPRRSARFANQQKPSSGSSTGQQQPRGTHSQGGQNSAQAHLQCSWLQTFIWVAWALLAVLMAVMAATNPSRAAFVDSISQLTSRGLGKWAGVVLMSPCVHSLAHPGTKAAFAVLPMVTLPQYLQSCTEGVQSSNTDAACTSC